MPSVTQRNFPPVSLGFRPLMMADGGVLNGSLKEKLLQSVRLVADSREETDEFDSNDFRWMEVKPSWEGPTGRYPGVSDVYLNRRQIRKALKQQKLTPAQEQKYLLMESIHNLKRVDPEQYNDLLKAAGRDSEYHSRLPERFQYAVDRGENRPLEDWFLQSQFDRDIGGYLWAGDPDVPSLKTWKRKNGIFGPRFAEELEKLRLRLGLE